MTVLSWIYSAVGLFASLSGTCIRVSTFDDILQAIHSSPSGADNAIKFCPFRIQKPSTSFLEITADVNIGCSLKQLCILYGSGNHITVSGGATNAARLQISDFVFFGATQHILHFNASDGNRALIEHEIRRCVLRDSNAGTENGGAIYIGEGVSVKVVATRFQRNQAARGGALFHAGAQLTLNGVRFDKNRASQHGGAVFLAATSVLVNITNSLFTGNLASATKSGAVFAQNISTVLLLRDGRWTEVEATDNYGCNGIYDASTQICYPFLLPTTPVVVPFMAPVPLPTVPAPVKIPIPTPVVNVPAPRPTVPVPVKIPLPTPATIPVRNPTVPTPVAPPPTPSSFVLGNLTPVKNGLRLSRGLTARIIAQTGQPVLFTSPEASQSSSTNLFHAFPDGAAVFALPDGGYVYTSNSEIDRGGGGVYGVEFDSQGRVRNYKALLTGTNRNCNGGRTPWNTWVSCEEVPRGQCWQVDPQGVRSPQQTVLGGTAGGAFEAFAYDARNSSALSFFVTEDLVNGTVRRYRPPANTPLDWNMLHGSGGTLDYLEFLPSNQFRWTTSMTAGRLSALTYFRNSEGIAVFNKFLYFVSKVQKQLFKLDLDLLTYSVISILTSTLPGGGSFDDQPDHVYATANGVILFTEDGGPTPGIFAYDGSKYLSYFESDFSGDEMVGYAFSPDRKYMFACIQDAGLLYQVSRDDGLLFNGRRFLKWRNWTRPEKDY